MKRKKFSAETISGRLVLFLILGLSLVVGANGQKPKCKKWTYDFSEVVNYFDTPLEACKSYVKEKYPNGNETATVEAANDPETYRCSAGDTYIGVVYQRECTSCCKKTGQTTQGHPHFNLRPLIFNSLVNQKGEPDLATQVLLQACHHRPR